MPSEKPSSGEPPFPPALLSELKEIKQDLTTPETGPQKKTIPLETPSNERSATGNPEGKANKDPDTTLNNSDKDARPPLEINKVGKQEPIVNQEMINDQALAHFITNLQNIGSPQQSQATQGSASAGQAPVEGQEQGTGKGLFAMIIDFVLGEDKDRTKNPPSIPNAKQPDGHSDQNVAKETDPKKQNLGGFTPPPLIQANEPTQEAGPTL